MTATKWKPAPLDPFQVIPQEILDALKARAAQIPGVNDAQLVNLMGQLQAEQAWALASWPLVRDQLIQAVRTGQGPISSDPSALA